MATSSPPSTHYMPLISLSCSHHSYHLYIIPWSPPSLLSLVICLSSHQHALITAIASSAPVDLHLSFHSSSVSHLLSSHPLSAHYSRGTSFSYFTRQLSLISTAGSIKASTSSSPPWPPPPGLSLVICLSSHQHPLITAIASSSFPGHLLSAHHSSCVSHLIIML
jgi:hypothetical protein